MFDLDPKIEAFQQHVYNTPLIQDVWRDKYYYGDESHPNMVYERVAMAIASSPVEDPNRVGEVATKFKQMMVNRLFVPGGRILAGAGTDKRVTLMNCFAGNTKFYTKEYGTVTLQEVVNKEVTVLTSMGWYSGTIKSFGKQSLQKVSFQNLAYHRKGGRSSYRAEVVVTPNHRWILSNGRETTNLKCGDSIIVNGNKADTTSQDYANGFRHGMIFGDGQLHRTTLREVSGGYPEGTLHHVLRLCGDKAQYLDHQAFKGYTPSYFHASGDDPILYFHGVEAYKELPETTKSSDYTMGFIDGWFAADGHWENGKSQKVIATTNQEAIEWAINNMPLGGYVVTGRKVLKLAGTKTNLGILKNTMEGITFRSVIGREWVVENIEPSNEDEVYCAVVPEIGMFTLANGILTGNCYVNGTIEDSMEGISDAWKRLMLTSQQGGGMGSDFSPIRPNGAILARTQSVASGPLPFMDSFNAGGKTVRSAGDRRAAQMGVICDTHPDMPAFVKAKGEGLLDGSKRFAEFNLSVLISDAFMAAKADDEMWPLYFHVPPKKRDPNLAQHDFMDDEGVKQYVYAIWRAKELWELITRYTYDFSDPGVHFVDRTNDLNNLAYCERISCTNPCVTGDTLILTKQGFREIKSLVGIRTTIWNGSEWSEVVPFKTGLNPIMEVKFSNGHTIRCTPRHKWFLHNRVVETYTLKAGDKLKYVEMPPDVIESTEFNVDAYSQGMYCGDGTKNLEYSNLYKHDEGILNRLVGKIYDRNCESQPGTRWVHGPMLPKDFVPITGSVTYCVNWLAGYLDADGCVVKKKETQTLEASAKDRNFLCKVGLMLNRLGINYRMWERKDGGYKKGSNGKEYLCQSTASIMLSRREVYKLVQLGMRCERLDLSFFQSPPLGIANVGHRVLSVAQLEGLEETYCLNEPKRNAFVANGIITHNCGEQPLPPNGTCNLGAINVGNLVLNPFTDKASINFDLLGDIVPWAVRFLDNVIDVTNYPLPEQKQEELNKRRIGLGITGLGTLFSQLGVRYGSHQSVDVTERVMKEIAYKAYHASIELAKERGSFLLYKPEIIDHGFIRVKLDDATQESIVDNGLRNGVLLTVAPTGTTSIAIGNLESGLEPAFEHEYERRVRQNNTEEFKTYIEQTYTARFYSFCTGNAFPKNRPDFLATAQDIEIIDHIKIQAACQRWVDASVSKTINVPEDISYDKFLEVYELAYTYGCKGCTTYKPSQYRESILAVKKDPPTQIITDRPNELSGNTYKIKWPSMSASMYVTINYLNGKPYEIFFASKDAKFQDWMTGLTLMISAIMRSPIDPAFIPDELKQVVSTHDYGWVDRKHYGSLVARIGAVIEQDFIKHNIIQPKVNELLQPKEEDEVIMGKEFKLGEQCPSCKSPTLVMEEGCKNCKSCGYSQC